MNILKGLRIRLQFYDEKMYTFIFLEDLYHEGSLYVVLLTSVLFSDFSKIFENWLVPKSRSRLNEMRFFDTES